MNTDLAIISCSRVASFHATSSSLSSFTTHSRLGFKFIALCFTNEKKERLVLPMILYIRSSVMFETDESVIYFDILFATIAPYSMRGNVIPLKCRVPAKL